MKFSVFQVSRKGGRKNNEDRMGYCYTRGSAVFVLADGMGGHPDGEVAAQMALQSVANLFQKEAKPELPDVNAFLTNAVLAAHRQILRYGLDQAMLDSPRTGRSCATVWTRPCSTRRARPLCWRWCKAVQSAGPIVATRACICCVTVAS